VKVVEYNGKRTDHPKYPEGIDLNNPEVFQVTNYVNDISVENAEVLMTSDVDGNYRGVYTYGIDRISEEDLVSVEGKPNDPLYYLYDALGTTTAITNMNEGIIDSNRFAPYGEPLDPVAKNSRLTNSSFGYTGELHDIEAGTLYLRARYYEPGTMRFISQDTMFGDIMEPLSRNLYIYGNANPMTYVDPSGHYYIIKNDNGTYSLARDNKFTLWSKNIVSAIPFVGSTIVSYAELQLSVAGGNSATDKTSLATNYATDLVSEFGKEALSKTATAISVISNLVSIAKSATIYSLDIISFDILNRAKISTTSKDINILISRMASAYDFILQNYKYFTTTIGYTNKSQYDIDDELSKSKEPDKLIDKYEKKYEAYLISLGYQRKDVDIEGRLFWYYLKDWKERREAIIKEFLRLYSNDI
jgi:RHS repeat-associated protein